MFTRYIGGGIGHLEQFPPANTDNEDTTGHDDCDEDVEEIDDGGAVGDPECARHAGEVGDDGDGEDNRENGCEDDNIDEDEGVEDDEDMGEGEDTEDDDDSDLGEIEDEEIGNVY